MKPFAATVFLFCSLLVQSETVPAQGVYMTRGEKGPIFSDKPAPGAREVTLQPLTVVAPPKESGPTASATSSAAINDSQKPETAAATYRSFSVVSPENGGSVAANTAFFEVRVAVDPALQAELADDVSRYGRQRLALKKRLQPTGSDSGHAAQEPADRLA